MRSVLSVVSLLAFAVLGLGVLVVVGAVPLSQLHMDTAYGYGDGINLDAASLLLGLAAGILLTSLARVSWTEMPGRFATWLLANERNFARIAWGLIFVVILYFY